MSAKRGVHLMREHLSYIARALGDLDNRIFRANEE
jgi:hypothetical protein